MNLKITPATLSGRIAAIPSKSDVHRILVCAALSDAPTQINLTHSSEDIDATMRCLSALGAEFTAHGSTLTVTPIKEVPDSPVLDCGESGSTLRFLLPVAAAVSNYSKFTGAGRLPERPIKDLLTVMQQHGVSFSADKLPLSISGRMSGGDFSIAGNISSQYITGILLALPKIGGGKITLTTKLESSGYVDMTLSALRRYGIIVNVSGQVYEIRKAQNFISPGHVTAEGDWSNAAFFLAAGAIGTPVTVTGLDPLSAQKDKQIVDILRLFGANVTDNHDSVTAAPGNLHGCRIDLSEVPDMLPALAVVAACAEGETHFMGGARLRLKESDRIASVAALLHSLGGNAEELTDGLIVKGTRLKGGTVDSFGDHRIAMAAAIAATRCNEEVTMIGAGAVSKSYPTFFDDYRRMGGIYTWLTSVTL